jgi:signal transduction histidine kinase
MSQEMRTQLNTISGFVDLLNLGVKGDLSEGQTEYVGRIKKAVHLLLAGVNGLSESTALAPEGSAGGFEASRPSDLRLI